MADKNLLKQATEKLQDNWAELSKKDIARAKGDIEALVATIVAKTGDAASSVRERVERIVADVQARRQKKTFGNRVKGFMAGLLKFTAAMVAIAAAIAAGLMFWRKQVEKRSETSGFSSAEPPTMDQSATLHSAETPVAPTSPPPDETS
jgi:hypothetical protein